MRIYLAGHNSMVGAALKRLLKANGQYEIITASREHLDLRDQQAVSAFMQQARPDVVILAAAKVGGIHANNSFPADFIYDNLMIQTNVVHAAFHANVERLLQLGSSCIYPRAASQPIVENALMSGPLEPTNEPYAIAKIAGIKLCESYNRQYATDYRSLMPTNLYGPGDNFHPQNAHVLPALIQRFHEAVEHDADQITIWGTGRPLREFLHVDDLAHAAMFVLGLTRKQFAADGEPMCSHVNVGSGEEVTIAKLAQLIAKATGFQGTLHFDASKPDGTPRKRLDTSRLERLGWTARTTLQGGINATYDWYRAQIACGEGLRHV